MSLLAASFPSPCFSGQFDQETDAHCPHRWSLPLPSLTTRAASPRVAQVAARRDLATPGLSSQVSLRTSPSCRHPLRLVFTIALAGSTWCVRVWIQSLPSKGCRLVSISTFCFNCPSLACLVLLVRQQTVNQITAHQLSPMTLYQTRWYLDSVILPCSSPTHCRSSGCPCLCSYVWLRGVASFFLPILQELVTLLSQALV